MTDIVRVRIAPSPTGYFHVGNARTALFNWLFARQQDGAFVCRIEDTDRRRYVEGALDDMFASLEWLGIEPDESPRHGGAYGPYRQSERLGLYASHAQQLLNMGGAYRCFCTAERLAERREQRTQLGRAPVYDRRCRNLTPEEVARRLASGEPSVIRLRVPLEGTIAMNDFLRGRIEFQAADLEDIILIKADLYPTYHFAVVVDDHTMAISHVLRADEWIPSVPYQILLYRAFGWPEPIWVHLPMVLNPDGKGKLSKRKTVDAEGRPLVQMTQVREYRAAGYLPEAMFNYLALQGWAYSGSEEVFDRQQALARFRLQDLKTSPAAWDPAKLAWLNGVYIRKLAPDELARRLLPFLESAGLPADLDTVRRATPLIQERLTTLADAAAWLRFLWQRAEPSPDDLVPQNLTVTATARWLAGARDLLAQLPEWSAAAIENALRSAASSAGYSARVALQPVRVAVTGQRVSPPLFESLALLGREETLARLELARGRLLASDTTQPPD